MSKFKVGWDLSRGVQKYLSVYLSGFGTVFSHDSLAGIVKAKAWGYTDFQGEDNLAEITGRTGADYIILGRIMEFYMIKKMVGSGKFGGYKHYNAGIKLKVDIYNTEKCSWMAPFDVKVEKRDIGLRLNLPGRLSKDEENFDRIDEEAFGSDVFKQTVAGEVLNEVCQQIHDKIKMAGISLDTAVTPKVPKVVLVGKILTIKDGEIYVNLGMDDQILIGDRFPVYAQGEPIIDPDHGDTLGYTDELVGEVEITFLKAAHLSSAKVLRGKDVIKVRDKVRVLKY
jgi:hypothetical protein